MFIYFINFFLHKQSFSDAVLMISSTKVHVLGVHVCICVCVLMVDYSV